MLIEDVRIVRQLDRQTETERAALMRVCDLAERVLTLQAQGAKMVMPDATEGMVKEYLKPEYGIGFEDVFRAMHTAAPDLLAEGVG
jgi:hypothetical protein